MMLIFLIVTAAAAPPTAQPAKSLLEHGKLEVPPRMRSAMEGTYNESQMKAVTAGLDGSQVILVQGPPGQHWGRGGGGGCCDSEFGRVASPADHSTNNLCSCRDREDQDHPGPALHRDALRPARGFCVCSAGS